MSEISSEKFELVKSYLADLELTVVAEDAAEELVVVEDEEAGIKNLVIDCEAPIVVIEQLILKLENEPEGFFRRLLQINRSLVHGAFVLDDDGKSVFFRDTLQLENLDLNELEGSISALALAMAENSAELLRFAQSS